MKFILIILFFLALTICSKQSIAQVISFSGKILDAHTQEPVSFASVYFTKTTIGVTADSVGHFSFDINKIKNDTLVVSFVGYADYKLPVSDSLNHQFLNIQMQHGKLSNAVVVKFKFNKGHYLWTKIMSKKKYYNRYNLTNFSYEAYNKLEVDIKNFNANKVKKNFILKPFGFVLDNIDSTSEKDPFLPAYLVETMSDYAFQKNVKRTVETIKASNTKGFQNESITRLLGVMNQNVNCYGNYINVIDKDFIGPFNDNADQYYNFYVPDTQIVNGRKIFHFLFKPKHVGQNTFDGDAWVFAQTFQIQKINLYLGKEANINYIDRVSVFQEFTPLNDSIYFLTRDKFYADFRVLGKNSLTLIGRKTTSYRNITYNTDSITNIFKNQNIQEIVKTKPGNNLYSDSAWTTLRHDTLSKNEKAIYTTLDRLLEMPKFKRLENTLKFIGTGYKSFNKLEIGPWYNWLSVDGWEGYRTRFDLGTTPKLFKNLYLHSYLAYGFRDQKFKEQAEAYWFINRHPKLFRLHLAYTNDIDNDITEVGSVAQDNIFTIAVRKPNTTRKYLQLKDLRFETFNELGRGFSTEWFLSHRQFTPLKNLPFIPSATGDTQSLNNFEVALHLRWAYLEQFFEGDYFRYSLGTRYPIIELDLAKGFPGVLGSSYSYNKIAVSVKDNIKISPYGILSYKVYAGQIFGSLPFTFLENHSGNDIYYYNYGGFNLMNRFEYLSDKYAGFNLEHSLGSGLFRYIPLTRKLKLRQFWNVKTVWGSLSSANNALNNSDNFFKTLNGKPYMEAGTGVDNILKVFRIDLVWRVLPTPLPVNQSARFGIFGSFQFQF